MGILPCPLSPGMTDLSDFELIPQRPSLPRAVILQGDVFFYPARDTLILGLVKRGWGLLLRNPTWDHLVDVGYNILPAPVAWVLV